MKDKDIAYIYAIAYITLYEGNDASFALRLIVDRIKPYLRQLELPLPLREIRREK